MEMPGVRWIRRLYHSGVATLMAADPFGFDETA